MNMITGRMGKLIQSRKVAHKSRDIMAMCPQCQKQKPTHKMRKSPVDGKHYCTRTCLEKANKGDKQVARMQQLAGIKD